MYPLGRNGDNEREGRAALLILVAPLAYLIPASRGDPCPPEPEREFPCLTYTRSGGREGRYCGIPFQPFSLSTLTPEGAWAVGTTHTYAFEIRKSEGSTLRIERYWTPVPVSAEEAAYRRGATTRNMRERIARDPSWSWNGPEIPDHKPAYRQIWPDRNGRIWVLREGPSRLSTECVEDVPDGSPSSTGWTFSAPTAASWARPLSIASRTPDRSSTARPSSPSRSTRPAPSR